MLDNSTDTKEKAEAGLGTIMGTLDGNSETAFEDIDKKDHVHQKTIVKLASIILVFLLVSAAIYVGILKK